MGDDDPLQDPQNSGEGSSVEDRTANGEQVPPPDPPMGGDVQLSLNVGGLLEKNGRRVLAAFVSLSAAQKEVDGLFAFDTVYPFLVRGKPGAVVTQPIEDPKTGKTKGVNQRQRIAVDSVQRADTSEVIRELFADMLRASPAQAGQLLDALKDDASAVLKLEPAAA